MFDPTLELLDGPLGHLILSLVLARLRLLHVLGNLKGHVCCGARHRKLYGNLRSEVVLREKGPYLHCEAQSVARLLVDEGVDAEWGRVLTIDAIVHHEELAIGWLDRHCLHRLKIVRIDTLMEVAVIENHTSVLFVTRTTHCQVVVQYESQLWIANQVTLHLDDTIDRRIDNHTIWIEQYL